MIGEMLGAFVALLFVLALIALIAWGARRFGLVPGQPVVPRRTKEIEILEVRPLDARNRLVLVRWNGADYLVGAGAEGLRLIDRREGATKDEAKA
ncbi:flagellar biosynthetic protein FliO [Pseudokordiimonas caeni]|uniref:flagellar biosynthetic protein FliO n=1 Tax=Pseudokordiimonas caeni TaxID=2997908 RepID=UPI0028114220|nr:flagellar biosynthetic protein FliO [Pseudokordiimonas caeni]